MTTRHCGYVVLLAEDIREDDGEHVVNAIRMLRGVISVEPIVADPLAESLAETRVKHRLFAAIRGLLFGDHG